MITRTVFDCHRHWRHSVSRMFMHILHFAFELLLLKKYYISKALKIYSWLPFKNLDYIFPHYANNVILHYWYLYYNICFTSGLITVHRHMDDSQQQTWSIMMRWAQTEVQPFYRKVNLWLKTNWDIFPPYSPEMCMHCVSAATQW